MARHKGEDRLDLLPQKNVLAMPLEGRGREMGMGREERRKVKGVEFPHLFNPTLTTVARMVWQ